MQRASSQPHSNPIPSQCDTHDGRGLFRERYRFSLYDGHGSPDGPLTLLDLIGVDTVYRGASAIYQELGDPQYNPPTLMRKMVAMGWHGRKTGKGFYEYH